MNSYLYHFTDGNGEYITKRHFYAHTVEEANGMASAEIKNWCIKLYALLYSINGRKQEGPFDVNESWID